MSPLALHESPAQPIASQGERLFEPAGKPTLDDVISKAWESLSVRGNAHCLVCGELLVRSEGDGAAANDAECAGCGASLS